MRFLVDNALSPVLATLLSRAGHDALHVRTIELQRAEDLVIFDKAAAVDRIVVSADTDFGALLAARNVRKPSVIQFRGPGSRKPDALARVMLSNLPQLSDALERGSIVTFEPSRVRVRALPINTISVDD
jgi:predicted nuclease of predicted toxin-antitoxin system